MQPLILCFKTIYQIKKQYTTTSIKKTIPNLIKFKRLIIK